MKRHGIGHVFLGKELGGKPRDPGFPAEDSARFAVIGKTAGFRAGLDRLLSQATRIFQELC
ncbi:MAG TPA: hypothetical protein VLM91_01690 [Candidatus Methylomirabilis sp.]|nr:hypothetical protein [Candidatus Methylomirabilis sp.]